MKESLFHTEQDNDCQGACINAELPELDAYMKGCRSKNFNTRKDDFNSSNLRRT